MPNFYIADSEQELNEHNEQLAQIEQNDADCRECNRDGYILHNCCSGYQCGCMGSVVAFTFCKSCNPKGKKEPPESIIDIIKHLEHWD